MADPNRPVAPLVATKTHWLVQDRNAGGKGGAEGGEGTTNPARAVPRSSGVATGWAAGCSPPPPGVAASTGADSDSLPVGSAANRGQRVRREPILIRLWPQVVRGQRP